jgi:hypothetical protein
LTLKLPICNFDAKTGILCSNCEAKLKAGQITKAEIEASRALVGHSDHNPRLNKAELTRAYEAGGAYVLEFVSPEFQHLRDDQTFRSELESSLKGKVWLVQKGSSDRKFLEDLLHPVKVLTVNTVWNPDGTKRTKVIVPSRRMERQIGDFDKLRSAARKARGIELLLETEREALATTGY